MWLVLLSPMYGILAVENNYYAICDILVFMRIVIKLSLSYGLGSLMGTMRDKLLRKPTLYKRGSHFTNESRESLSKSCSHPFSYFDAAGNFSAPKLSVSRLLLSRDSKNIIDRVLGEIKSESHFRFKIPKLLKSDL